MAKEKSTTASNDGGSKKNKKEAKAPQAVPGNEKSESKEPKSKKIKNEVYEAELARLQIDLVKLQEWIREEGLRVVVIFEGRDAAGKGGVIKRIAEKLHQSPGLPHCRSAARTPTERERDPVVLSALRPPSSGRRRDGASSTAAWYNRGRCRARDALLQRGRVSRVHAHLPRVRAHARAGRDSPGDQVLVLRERRRAGAALPGQRMNDPTRSAGS